MKKLLISLVVGCTMFAGSAMAQTTHHAHHHHHGHHKHAHAHAHQ